MNQEKQKEALRETIAAARGLKPADLVLAGGLVADNIEVRLPGI